MGPRQRLYLVALMKRDGEAPMSTTEVAERVAHLDGLAPHQRRPIMEGERAANTLRTLMGKGYVNRLGKSASNAWCWEITEAGLDALGEAIRLELS